MRTDSGVQVMTGEPVTVKPDDQLEAAWHDVCARLSPSTMLDAGKVVGVISVGDVVKDIIQIGARRG